MTPTWDAFEALRGPSSWQKGSAGSLCWRGGKSLEYGVEECSGGGISAAAHSSGLVFLAEHSIKSCWWYVHAALFIEASLWFVS